MRMGSERESPHFEDLTPYTQTKQGQSLLQSLVRPMPQGAPGGFGSWLVNGLRSLTPNDLYIMKNQGIPLEIMLRAKAVRDGTFPIDYSDYPYSDDYANKGIRKSINGSKELYTKRN